MYKLGRENIVADALSRSLEDVEEILFSSNLEGAPGSLLYLSRPIYSLIDEIKNENLRSSEAQNIIKKYVNFRVRGGQLFYKDRYFVSRLLVVTPPTGSSVNL